MTPRAPFDRVRRLARALEGVEEGTSYGSPALKVGGKMFACIPVDKSAEPNTLAVRMSFVERDLRLEMEPDIYYLRPHYVNYPCVLARLRKISDAALRELLETGWTFERTTRNAFPLPNASLRSRIRWSGRRRH
jgi:hypothetical protein